MVTDLSEYLAMNGMRLELDQSPPLHAWRKAAKVSVTCLRCDVTDVVILNNLQQGNRMGCMCSKSRHSLTRRWYYEKAIARPWTDDRGLVWYARLHDGSIEPVTWDTWTAAAAHGSDGHIGLTCTHCGHTNDTTSINSLQVGQGMSCMCGGGKDVLATEWYYSKVIAAPFTDRKGKLWFPRLHDGTIDPVTLETWLAAAAQGASGYLTLTCSHCKHTNNSTRITHSHNGTGMSCMCGDGKDILATPWYFTKAIANPFTARDGKLWYARLHDGSIEPVTWETWLAAATSGSSGRLKLTCARCGYMSESTSICNLQAGQGMSCKCTMSTSQRKVLTWLQAQRPELTWEPEIRDCTRNGRALPFDLACRALALLVEVDGDQHFEVDGHFVRTLEQLEHRVQTDLFKEQWAVASGFSVARLYWADVLYDQADWQGYLHNILEQRATLDNMPPAVHVPAWTAQYTSGLYHDARIGSALCEPLLEEG